MITFRDKFAEREFCEIAAAIVGAAAIGTVGSVVASQSAAGAETKAANQANSTLQQNQAQVRTDLAPYNQGGQGDFAAYNNLVNNQGNPAQQQAELQSLPGYQFQLTQGLKSTQNAAAARGLGVSGAALKGAAGYATGLAQSNYNTEANALLSGSQLGENAAAQTGVLGTQSAIAQGNNTTSAGNAQAAGDIATGNALSGGLNSLFLYNALSGSSNSGGLFGGGGNAPEPTGWQNGPPESLYSGQ